MLRMVRINIGFELAGMLLDRDEAGFHEILSLIGCDDRLILSGTLQDNACRMISNIASISTEGSASYNEYFLQN